MCGRQSVSTACSASSMRKNKCMKLAGQYVPVTITMGNIETTSNDGVQYCATIGQLEPSFVIRRFLDAQRIHNLTSYLEALHTRVRAARPNLQTFRTSCEVCQAGCPPYAGRLLHSARQLQSRQRLWPV